MSKYGQAPAVVDIRLIDQVTGKPKSLLSSVFFELDEEPFGFKSDSFTEAT